MTEAPKGLIAEMTLKSTEPEAKPVERPALITTPSDLPVDPNYMEPTPLDGLKNIALAVARLPDEDIKTRDEQRGKFINLLLSRIGDLEAALMPFSQQGIVMSNAKMCLRSVNRGDEPGGGHWINQVTSTHLAKSENNYYNAIDVIGRKRSEENMMQAFARLQTARKLQSELEKHIEAGGTIQ